MSKECMYDIVMDMILHDVRSITNLLYEGDANAALFKLGKLTQKLEDLVEEDACA